ncbi:MAG: type VI secretion system lipoprotein TssJ [Rhodanobacter sp.]
MELFLIRHLARNFALFITIVGLSSCASGGGVNQPGPITKAMQAIGLAKSSAAEVPKPASADASEQQLSLRVFTGKNLNAGAEAKPLALVVKLYQLRSLERFQQAPYDDFIDSKKTEAALGDDLIRSHEMLVLPNQRYAKTETLPAAAHYVGIVALFRSPAAQRWRFAYDVEKSKASGITLGLHACAMSSTAGAIVTELPDSAGSLASVHCPKL